MWPFTLPEQDPVARRIREAANRGTLPHALLFSGSGDTAAAAQLAAAAMECVGEGARPCGHCAGCRKVQQGIHPDVITVRDDEHKNVAVEIIRQVRADAYIRPNEGARKVYIFPDCSLLTDADQNVLLKVVEEGPPYAAFLFCAKNSAAVLQTLRSRCVEMKLRPVRKETEEDEQAREEAEALCRLLAASRRNTIAEHMARLEKQRLKREEVGRMVAESRELMAQALLRQYGCAPREDEREIVAILAKNLTKTQIVSTIEVLQKYREDCSYNIGPGHVLGALAVELEGIL